jgi:hypothetical protein
MISVLPKDLRRSFSSIAVARLSSASRLRAVSASISPLDRAPDAREAAPHEVEHRKADQRDRRSAPSQLSRRFRVERQAEELELRIRGSPELQVR